MDRYIYLTSQHYFQVLSFPIFRKKTEGIQKTPIKSYYNVAGDLILGEKVTLFYENTDGEINKIDQANIVATKTN